jgi:subtilisin family serine protease
MADWFPDDPAYNICVSASANSETSSRAENNSHGLFIGGLVHALAPASDIHLIQVLDENATGTVSTLQSALYQFAQNNSFNLQSAIINLSLGIPNSALIDTGNLTEYVARLVDAGVLATDVLTMAQQTDSAALGLYLALAVYDAQGAVVVAASGNDGGDIQLPAGFPMVLGVAGSTIDGGRACFSNAGDMAAPGGDAGEAPCTKLVNDVCPADAPCDQALVSLVHPAVAPSGYAFWAGTSFATPLVSGLAAVARGQAVALSPDVIRTCILENADPAGVGTTIGALGEGIADVPPTLSNCSP